jgi:battenin
MAGVVLASLSSGMGELSFLSLTHYFGPFSLAAWGSGTGGAGLVGAGAYALATTSMGLSSKNTLFASAFLPIIMLVSFFLILPRGPLKRRHARDEVRGSAATDHEDDTATASTEELEAAEEEGLLTKNPTSSDSKSISRTPPRWTTAFLQNLRRSQSLFFP